MEDTVQLWPPRPLQSKKLRCLAPMVRANSTPLRILALDYGADIVYSEELIARRLELCTRKDNEELKTIDFVDASGKTTCLRVDPVREKDKLVVQLGAAEGECASRAAAVVADVACGVDLNMGCPKPFSTGGGMGQALLKDGERAASIVKSLRRTLPASVAVTCKIRLLPEISETCDLIRQLHSAGAVAVALHCRYAGVDPPKDPQLPTQQRVFERLRQEHVAFREDCALLANGDLYTHDAISNVDAYTDGVLLARPALLDPSSIFRSREERLPKLDVLQQYVRYAQRYDAHPKNTKYVVQEMLAKRRHPSEMRGVLRDQLSSLPFKHDAVTATKTLGDLAALVGVAATPTSQEPASDGRVYSDDYFDERKRKRPSSASFDAIFALMTTPKYFARPFVYVGAEKLDYFRRGTLCPFVVALAWLVRVLLCGRAGEGGDDAEGPMFFCELEGMCVADSRRRPSAGLTRG